MIDFRYHLVSIIAVFFALAVGIVLGAGPLGERVDENLPDQLAAANERNRELQDQILTFESAQGYQQSFIDAVGGELVGERLPERDVVVVTLPDADEDLTGQVRDMLGRSGATITGTVAVRPAWTEPDAEAALDALAVELVATESLLPEDGDGYERAAAVLADAVLTSVTAEDVTSDPINGLGDELADATWRVADEAALAGFTEAGFVEVDGELTAKANAAVIIAGPPEGEDAEGSTETLTPLVAALDEAGKGAVAAGNPATASERGMLGLIRASDLAAEISTVDSAELVTGRIAVVYAVAEQWDGGVGHYGVTTDGDEVAPPIPPRPEPDAGAENGSGGDADGESGGDDSDGEGEDS